MTDLSVSTPRELAAHYKATRKRLWTKPKRVIVIPIQDGNAIVAVPVPTLDPDIIVETSVENTDVHTIQTNQPTIALIAKVVCEHYKITSEEIISKRRSRRELVPRQVAMYFARTMTSRSYPFIGSKFGGRDHTTCMHSINRITSLLGCDPELAEEIEVIRKKIEQAMS